MSHPSNQPAASSDRNQYIPSFISKKPFYAEDLTSDSDYLEHQRLLSVPKDTLDKAKWYERGKKAGPAATKYRKGACENCGAMTHKTKECLSRPRKTGAKWTGRDIQADEVVDSVDLGWDAKRDRWNGYGAREYNNVVREYEELEALKRSKNGDVADEDENEAKYTEETDMGRSQPTSTRQLRLREDTAKYLINLDLDSAKYDPKTRSMDHSASLTLSKNPGGDSSTDPTEEGFVRPQTQSGDLSGDASAFEAAQRYAWETQESAKPNVARLHLQANPTEGEYLLKKSQEESAARKEATRKALLDKYGGAEHEVKPALLQAAAVTENERYVEYDESGAPKGQPKKVARSKYAEDVFTNNHTSVWGSWWRDFQWGYRCCHSTVKNSYCTGEEGRRAFEEAEERKVGEGLLLEDAAGVGGLPEDGVEGSGLAEDVTERKRDNDGIEDGGPEERIERTNGEQAQRSRLQQDGEDVQERKDDVSNIDTTRKDESGRGKKRTLQEIQSGVTEEELEAYKRNRMASDDPMRDMLGRDDILE